jgi:putative ABC transport system permease protein
VIELAWRNLWRQPKRTLLTVAAIAFAALVMVFLLAFQVGTYAIMEENTLSLFDGDAQVQQPGYLDDPGIRKSFATEPLAASVARVPGVDAVAARAQTYALLSKDQRSLAALIVGVEPKREARVSRVATMVRDGRYLETGDAAEMVLGDALARNLGIKVGDRVTMLGMGRDGSVAADVLTVAGVFSTGVNELDRNLAEMPLARFGADFAMPGQAHAIVISGTTLANIDDALPALRNIATKHNLTVRDWGELEPGLKNAIRLDASTSLLWYVALIVVVVAILLNTLLMSVLERTREFGVLLALGMRPAAAGRMVWIEIMLLLAIGLAAGIAVGAAAAGWFEVHGLPLPGGDGVFAQWGLPGRIYPHLNWFSLFAGPAAIAVLTAAAGLFPYLRLRRLDPVTAMRSA